MIKMKKIHGRERERDETKKERKKESQFRSTYCLFTCTNPIVQVLSVPSHKDTK